MKHSFFWISLLVLISSCSTTPPRPVTASSLPLQSASLEQLVGHINQSQTLLRSFKGTLFFGFQSSATLPLKNCEGLLLFKQPDLLLLKTYTPMVPNYFSIFIANKNFWVYFPNRKTVFMGREADLFKQDVYEIRLYPFDLLKAFVPATIDMTRSNVRMEEKGEEYWISVFAKDNTLERQIVINRRGLMITKELYFTPQGLVQLEILRNEYVNREGIYFSKNVSLRRLPRDSRFYLTFSDFQVNPEISPEVFQFKKEEGVTVEDLGK